MVEINNIYSTHNNQDFAINGHKRARLDYTLQFRSKRRKRFRGPFPSQLAAAWQGLRSYCLLSQSLSVFTLCVLSHSGELQSLTLILKVLCAISVDALLTHVRQNADITAVADFTLCHL